MNVRKKLKKLPKEKQNKPEILSSFHKFGFLIQPSVRQLCEVLNISPDQLLKDFLDVLSCGSWNREGKDKLRAIVIEYILESKYGQEFYSTDDIRQMFSELNAIGLLYPKDGEDKTLDAFVSYRGMYHKYWLDKWINKYRRIKVQESVN